MKFNNILKLPYVPKYEKFQEITVEKLQRFVINCDKLFLMTGAGISTESGIPDYRSKDVGLYARTDHRPMLHSEFISSNTSRRRYWARNFIGWPKFSSTIPNVSHRCLTKWQERGFIHTFVTQNVDSLHSKAGSKDVIELHGATHRVICLKCKNITDRNDLQTRLSEVNRDWTIRYHDNGEAPDGDVLLDDKDVIDFKVVHCDKCGDGILKPYVTFFGGNVDNDLVIDTFDKLKQCDKVLVVGSSLSVRMSTSRVFSGYRFVLQAAKYNMPISILNIGETRADHLATLKIETKIGDILPRIIC